MVTNAPLSVTELSNYIKLLLDNDNVLSQITVRGELSNYKMHSSGHHYFTLKDEGAVISAVMFRNDCSRLKFRPESGMKVILSGRVSSFPKSGQYQIYATAMQPDGVGALYIAFDQLKAKLLEEGLFSKQHKKALPLFPKKIAIITSPTGAAVRDMIRILGARFPACEIIVCPVKVQGDDAGTEIAEMIQYVNKYALCDVIITGRGGGSIEDLWAFNEEVVARAIFESTIPIISAVGHEPDITISDYVADVRASTPSNGAEIAVRDSAQVRVSLNNALSRLINAQQSIVSSKRNYLNSIAEKKILKSPYGYIDNQRLLLTMLQQRIDIAMHKKLTAKNEQFVGLTAALDAMSPLKVLSRGYALSTKDGVMIKSVKQLKKDDNITIDFCDGSINCSVQNIVEREN